MSEETAPGWVATPLTARTGLVIAVCGLLALLVGTVIQRTAPVESAPAGLSPIAPFRMADTRGGSDVTGDRRFEGGGARPAGSVLELQIAGRGGVPATSRAVMVTVTAVTPAADGFITVYACGRPLPHASFVNYAAGDVVSNTGVTRLDEAGRLCVFTSAPTDLVIDAVAFVTHAGAIAVHDPARLLDTRGGDGEVTIDQQHQGTGMLAAGATLELQVAGRGGIPGNAGAVMLTLVSVGGNGPGYLTAYPCDRPLPTSASLNFAGGDVVANTVLTKVGAGGTVCIYASTDTQVVADVNASFSADAGTAALAPARVLDTREGSGNSTFDGRYERLGKQSGGSTLAIDVAGRGEVPADASAVMLNLGVVNPRDAGYLTVFPCGTDRPAASSMTFARRAVTSSSIFTRVGSDGSVCIYSSVDTHLVADVNAAVVDEPTPEPVVVTEPTTTTLAAPVTTSTMAPTTTVAAVAPTTVAPSSTAPAAVTTTSPTTTAAPTTTTPPTTSPPTTAPPTTTTSTTPVTTTTAVPTTSTTSTTTTTTTAATTTAAPTTTTTTSTTTTTVAPVPTVPSAIGTVVGSQSYPVPTGALIVSPNGSDSAPGTSSQPLRTVARALSLSTAGGTIVLRGGIYRESLAIGKKVTIQSWPGEAVWFDGSQQVSDWVADGNAWRHDGWTIEFDTSPTYTRGATDGSQLGWTFVDPNYPMAAHPDQIWIDGVALRQVGSRAALVAGTFFHDRGRDQLFIGSNPAGKTVNVSALVRALMVRADGVVLRGFGVRRYAPSVPDMGAITVERPNVRLEHLAVTDMATTGISVISANARLTNVHVARAGMLGIHGNYADGLVIDRVLVEGNNVEHFNSAPVAGGIKITKARTVTVSNSLLRGNLATGLWFDQSVYDIKVLRSEIRTNTGHGLFLEISNKALVADNVFQGNGGFGIKYNNTSNGRIWNNTFVGNNRSLNIVQDTRRYGDGFPGTDPRYPNDPGMTWINGPVDAFNNVLANQAAGNCLLCVEDYSKEYTAEQMRVKANGNVYNRPTSTSPSWVVVWSRGASSALVFTTVDGFRSATGQEATGTLVTGNAVVTSTGVPTAYMPPESHAQPLPSDVAALIGQPAGTRHLGAF